MHGSTQWIRLFLVGFLFGACPLLFADDQDATGGPDSETERAVDGLANQGDSANSAGENNHPNAYSISDEEDPFHTTSWLQPSIPPPPPPTGGGIALSSAAASVPQAVFAAEGVRRSLIALYRPTHAPAPGSEVVFGTEGMFRVTTDGGNLLDKSLFAPAIKVQQRTPVITDPRIRGSRYGGLLASGSYWAPARQDLDTVLSKIDSRIIRDVVVVKGPYSARYGPGFYFVDFQFLDTPRYVDGPRCFSSTSLEYKTNGEQWYGRQAIWGGGTNYGYRISYGHRTGNNYSTGSSVFDAGGTLPSSYNSRHLDAAFGYDFSPDSRLEFNYLRLDQTGVEFPGLVFDINTLYTDGFELRYTLEDQPGFDLLEIEGWYNRTPFHGDTAGSGKNTQMPSIRPHFGLAPSQFLVTDVDGMSAGYRAAVTWGQPGDEQLTIGTDLIRNGTQLNDIVPARTSTIPFPPFVVTAPSQNFPIPRSHSIDVGIFAEHAQPHGDRLTVRTGARVDFISTDARDRVPGMGVILPGFPPVLDERGLSQLKQSELDQQFYPWAVFAAADYEVNSCWTLTGGAGYAMRPPTLTELYAAGPFIGSLQPGLTFLEGDPQLDEERLFQLDLGIRADLGRTRMNLSGFHAWVHDYITYDDIGEKFHGGAPAFVPGADFQHVAFVNTELATLTGFEFTAEHDISDWLTGFALMSYVEGRDHTRTTPSRVAGIIRANSTPAFPANTPRSFDGATEKESLPGIPPLEARLGLHLHEPCPDPIWGIELEARLVDNQDLVAATLYEAETPGFTVWNARGYWRACENLTMFAGVENFTDRFYQEHLDYRSGRGVYRPGLNFYFLTEFIY